VPPGPLVLVTGAGGFIGRHLVSALRAGGTPVRALVRTSRDAAALSGPGVDVVVGDLNDEATTARVSGGVTAVYHLAGKLFQPGSDPRDYERLHVGATVRLFESCLDAGRLDFFLHCSTTGVHGPTGAVPAREDDPVSPQNAYERTKAVAEQAVRELARQRQAKLVIARPGLVYGPGDRHLLGWYRSIRDGYYRVVGPGTNHLHPIYIDDAIRATLLCPQRATPDGRAYHLVGPRPYTMRELSDAIGTAVGRAVPSWHLPGPVAWAAGAACELLPVPRQRLPLSRTRVSFLMQNRAYDGSRAHDELGFEPQVPLGDGLARTVAWYREQGWL